MRYIKQIIFDITQSRRIKNYVEQHKLSAKEVLKHFKEVVDLLYKNWKTRYGHNSELNFEEFLEAYLRYAEFAYRLKERKSDLQKISNHVNILREAIEEYERDYKTIIEIERIVKEHYKGSENSED